MNLTKKRILLTLFLSPCNPFLHRLRAFERGSKPKSLNGDDVQEITGVSRQTPENWRQGKEMRISKADGVFARVLAYLNQSAQRAKEHRHFDDREFEELRTTVARLDTVFEREELDLNEVAKLLGMRITECQKFIDSTVHDFRPLLPGVYYPPPPKSNLDADYAQREADRYEGLYLLWLDKGDALLQCTLHVRYLLPVGSVRFLRCRLNVPVASSNAAYLKFDGFLAIREQNLYWSFERRHPRHNDYFHLITAAPSSPVAQRISLRGQYLTTCLDDRQSITGGQLRMQRLFSDGANQEHERYRDVMHSYAKLVTDDAEIRSIRGQWKE